MATMGYNSILMLEKIKLQSECYIFYIQRQKGQTPPFLRERNSRLYKDNHFPPKHFPADVNIESNLINESRSCPPEPASNEATDVTQRHHRPGSQTKWTRCCFGDKWSYLDFLSCINLQFVFIRIAWCDFSQP